MKPVLTAFIITLLALGIGPAVADDFHVCKCREGHELWLWHSEDVAQLCKRRCPVQHDHAYTVNPETREVSCATPGLPHRVRYRSQTELELVTLDGQVLYTPTGLTPATVSRLFMGTTHTPRHEETFGTVTNTVPFQCHSDIVLSETYVSFRSGADLTHHLMIGLAGSGVIPLRPVLYGGTGHRVEAYPDGPRIWFGEFGEFVLQYCFDGTHWTSSKIVRLLEAEETDVFSPNDFTCGADAVVYASGLRVTHDPRR